ncbi:ATP-binding response regulator [Chitinophaga flava]|uniref:histidine kinase n=1 Tax=Chitinophaga flava TaxID=2259036 RepID=A0A365XW24_9BACT|nr:hybrid sensor histidine kinase/response regulator [Chitinophaga flava]RBL90288.1 hypothetical protein DF182_27880 [Chitinophaga flava]
MHNVIKTHIAGLYLDFINIGTQSAPVEDKPAIRIINILGLLTGVMVLGIGLYFYSLVPSLALLCGVITEGTAFLFLIYLNHKGLSSITKYAVLGIHCAGAIYFGALLGAVLPTTLMEALLFVFLIGGSSLIFRKNRDKWLMVLIGAVILMEVNDYYHVIRPLPLNPVNYHRFRWWSNGGALFLIIAVIWLLIDAIKGHDNARRKFLADTCHELRTPVNAVFQSVQQAQRHLNNIENKEDAVVLEQYIKSTRPAVLNAIQILNSVIEMSRIENGKYPVNKTDFLVVPWVSSIMDMLAPLAENQHQRIKLTYRQIAPVIYTDRLMVSQILINLLANAIKYGEKNADITLSLSSSPEGWFCMEVHNNGHIPEALQAGLFERYLTTNDNNNDGSGIGLDIVRNIITRLNGQISLKSNPVFGTSFQVVLKDVKSEMMNNATLIDDEQQPATHSFSGKRILIIDDDLSTFNSVKVLTRDCSLIQAQDGEEGLMKARTFHPDLILMDHKMSKITGLEALRSIRKDEVLKEIPVVLVSGEVFFKDEFFKAGADGFLSKPLEHQQLASVLLNMLHKPSVMQ